MSVVLLNREMVHYEVLGRGRPIIFLHGWVGSWRYWIPAMQGVSISYRAYALDLWGFGDSARVPERYHLERQAEMIDAFMDEMGISRVALVGHGLGAIVALMYAQSHPDVVDRLLAVSCPMGSSTVNTRLRSTSPGNLAEWLLGKTGLTEPVWADAPKTDPLAIQASLDGLEVLDVRAIWLQAQNANVFVHGQNDPVISLPDVQYLADLPEQSHAIVFEESAHFPMLDESNKFNRLLADFLALDSGESPRQLQLKEEWKRRVR